MATVSQPGFFTCEELRVDLLYDQEENGHKHLGHKDNQLLFNLFQMVTNF